MSPVHTDREAARPTVRDLVTRQRSRPAAVMDRLGEFLSRPLFIIALALVHLLWILLNLPWVPWAPWDPYPFTMLATIASVESPFVALLVLSHQKRQGRIEELREEMDLQLAMQLARRTTMGLRLLTELQRQLKVKSEQDEKSVSEMREDIDPKTMLKRLRKELRRDEEADETTGP